MTAEQIISIIRREYAETIKALDEAEKGYNSDRRSIKKREIYQYIAAQEAALSDLCENIGIQTE